MVVTHQSGECYLFDAHYPANAPIRLKLTPGVIATAVHMDDNFILLGDSDGLVSLFERGKGTPLVQLNDSLSSQNNVADQRRPFAPTVSASGAPGPQFTVSSVAVHCVGRVGRWVIVGREDGRVSIFDIHQTKGSLPVMEYELPMPGSVRSLAVDTKTLFLAVRPKAASKVGTFNPKPSIVIWCPALEGFELMTVVTKLSTSPLLVPLYYSWVRTTTILNDLKLLKMEKIDLTEYQTTLQSIQDIIGVLVVHGSEIKVHQLPLECANP